MNNKLNHTKVMCKFTKVKKVDRLIEIETVNELILSQSQINQDYQPNPSFLKPRIRRTN